MYNLFLLNDSITNGFNISFLDLAYIFAILFGIATIITKNPVVSVLFLIGLFGAVSGYLILVGLHFIGISYLLVYVGAVAILFLFILMLINIRISELLSETNNSIPLAVIIGISFNYPVYQILPFSLTYNDFAFSLNNISNNYIYNNVGNYLSRIFNNSIDNNIYYATSKLWDGNLAETTHITSIGNIMYTSHSIWLILTSIILLLAMVGAIVITIKQKG